MFNRKNKDIRFDTDIYQNIDLSVTKDFLSADF